MSIARFVDQGVSPCKPEDSLEKAAEIMLLSGFETLPICDGDGRVVGSVSMRSICRTAYLTRRPLSDLVVGEASGDEALEVDVGQSSDDVIASMILAGQWDAAVVDANRRFLGVVRYGRLRHEAGDSCGDRLVLIDDPERLSGVASAPPAGRLWLFLTGTRELKTPQGERIPLSRGEARLLLALAQDAGRWVSREALSKRICNRSYLPGDRYIDVVVAGLRRKFGERGSDARIIRTIHTGGYALSISVLDLCEGSPFGWQHAAQVAPRPTRRHRMHAVS